MPERAQPSANAFTNSAGTQVGQNNMDITPKFGPKETTQEQRQALAARAAALNATQGRKLSPVAEQLSQRYIKGELSLAEVNAQLEVYYPVGQGN